MSSTVAAIAVFGGLAVVTLTVCALIGSTKRFQPDTEPAGVAWRDGDDLVATVGSPLPARCVLCGEPSSYRAPASALLRNLGAHPDAAVALNATRLPLCEMHHGAQQQFERKVAFASVAAFMLLVVNVVVLIAAGGRHSAVMLLPGALAFAAVFAYSVTRRPGRLFVGRATVRHVRIHGASRALLDTLPSLTTDAAR